jgi:hypothetical protein
MNADLHRSRKVRLLAVTVTAAAAVLTLSATALATSSHSTADTICKTFVGPAWSAGTHSGTKYSLETFGGYTCKNATVWVKKLALVRLPTGAQNSHAAITGPSGFTCEASPDKKRHAFTGACRKVNTKTKVVSGFDWTASFF